MTVLVELECKLRRRCGEDGKVAARKTTRKRSNPKSMMSQNGSRDWKVSPHLTDKCADLKLTGNSCNQMEPDGIRLQANVREP